MRKRGRVIYGWRGTGAWGSNLRVPRKGGGNSRVARKRGRGRGCMVFYWWRGREGGDGG